MRPKSLFRGQLHLAGSSGNQAQREGEVACVHMERAGMNSALEG